MHKIIHSCKTYGDIFIGVKSICGFIVIMKVVEFLLDHLYGTGDLKTFTNGRTTPKARITTIV